MPRVIASFSNDEPVCPYCKNEIDKGIYDDYNVIHFKEEPYFWFTMLCPKCSKYKKNGDIRWRMEIVTLLDKNMNLVKNKNKMNSIIKKAKPTIPNLREE